MFLAMTMAFGVVAVGQGFGSASDEVVPSFALTEGEAQEQAEETGEPVQVIDLTTTDTVV
jgi:hypothetical protein